MTPLPFHDASARYPFEIVLGVFALLEWRVRLKSRRNEHGTRADRGSFYLVAGAVLVGLVGGIAAADHLTGAAITVGTWPLFFVGLALMVAGVAIRQWAVLTLGRFFTVQVRLHDDQRVVDGGPYRWVRHPSYTGMLLTLIGTGLALGNWTGLAIVAVVPTIGLVLRIRVEERVLLEGLGEPYREFAAGRARLFPGLW